MAAGLSPGGTEGAGPKGTIAAKPQQQVGAMAKAAWESKSCGRKKQKETTPSCTIAELT